jgi:hypothetical protein
MRLRDLLSQSNSAQSEKRLACSERAQRTGRAGFAISERDLDLRGAGDLFSKRQSGHVQVFAESAITRLEFDPDHLGKSPARYSLTARFASSVKQGNWERFDGPPEFQRLPVADLDASAAIIRSTVSRRSDISLRSPSWPLLTPADHQGPGTKDRLDQVPLGARSRIAGSCLCVGYFLASPCRFTCSRRRDPGHEGRIDLRQTEPNPRPLAIPAHGTREMPIWGERFNPIINLPHTVDRFIGGWPGRNKARKLSCEHASSLLSII